MQLLPIYLAGGGAALLVLGLIVYCVGEPRLRQTSTAVTAIAGLVLGVGLGMLVMGLNGYSLSPPPTDTDAAKNPPPINAAPPSGVGGPPPMKIPEGAVIPEKTGRVGKVFGVEKK